MNKKILVVGITLVLFAVAFGGCIQQNGTEETSGTVDSDGDGYYDYEDDFPHESTEWLDSDNDGYGDNSDAFPYDSSEWKDSDYDGVGDNSDFSPNNYLEWIDSDGDQISDNYDPFPNDITKWKDYSIPPEITEFNYDGNRFDIYNLRIETFAYNASVTKPGVRMGDGFLDVPNDYVPRYVFSFIIKNIAGEDIHEANLEIWWYDEDGNNLGGENHDSRRKWELKTESLVLEKDIYYQVFIRPAMLSLGSRGIHHFTVTLTETLLY